ncbi:MAG: hypothetical protein M0010_20760 [Actinomycetota bacterium]|nr:hypothetical protein [Actinomycetota bacterium]
MDHSIVEVPLLGPPLEHASAGDLAEAMARAALLARAAVVLGASGREEA